MAKILLVWEMGGGLGHIVPLKTLADHLATRGHHVLIATRDPIKTQKVFAGSGHSTLCAPMFAGLSINPTQICSLADMIWFDGGGHSAPSFSAILHSWRNLYIALGIDLVIADAAPCAIAAAQGLIPSVAYDTAFHATDAAAWTPFRDWEPIDQHAVGRRAEHLLEHLNQARAQLQLPTVTTLPEGFKADLILLRNVPQLDLHGARGGVVHVGVANNPGIAPPWPEGEWLYRILVYVRASYAHLERMLGALSRLEKTAVLYFHDGISESRLPRATHLRYVTEPLDLHLTLPQTDLVVCHGGGLQVQSALYGKPSLTLPLHTEQFVQSRQAQRAGVALMHSPDQRAEFITPIRSLLTDPRYRLAAQQLAAQHAQQYPDPLATVMLRIEQLLSA
jgi:hypothetical protein